MIQPTGYHLEKNGYQFYPKAIATETIVKLREEIEMLRSKHIFAGGLRRLVQLSILIAVVRLGPVVRLGQWSIVN